MSSLPSSAPILPNLLRYQAVWFATVLGAAHDRPDLGASLGFIVILWHCWGSRSSRGEYKTILMTLLLGAMWEAAMVYSGTVDYRMGWAVGGVPVWILVLWAAFGTTLNGCLGWLRQMRGLAAVLGGILGPLSWYAGARLGALAILDPSKGYLVLGLGWAVLMPVLSWMAKSLSASEGRFDGEKTP